MDTLVIGTETKYRVKGTTDENTQCGVCGKNHLKKTIVLATLDAEGNETDILWAGSSCASKLTGATSTRIRNAAGTADYRLEQDRALARVRLDQWACVEGNRRQINRRWFRCNPSTRCGGTTATEYVTEILEAARALVPDYAPDMRLHHLQVWQGDGGWTWGCKCGHQGHGYPSRHVALEKMDTDHETVLAQFG